MNNELNEYIKLLHDHIENMIFSKLGEGKKNETISKKVERVGYTSALLKVQEILECDLEIYGGD